MSITKRLAACAALCVFGISVLGITAGTAVAKPTERERIHESESEIIEDFCGDLTVRFDVENDVNFLLNRRGRNGVEYGQATVHGTASWTNVANDKSFTSVYNFVDKDLKVTENEDGTLTVLVMAAGSEKWYGPDGKLLFKNPGQTRFELLIDPATGEDEFLGVVKGSTGRNDTEGRDFCEDINEFIG